MTTRSPVSREVSADGHFSERLVERHLSDADLARTHVIGRNRRVGQVLCTLGLMKSHGLLPKGHASSVGGALVQDFESSGGLQAAHYLPGQLLIAIPGKSAVPPWTLIQNRAAADAFGALFSAVQDLPANFNKADSYVEMHARPGLKTAFAETCAQLLAETPRPAGQANRASVRAAYAHWIARSLASYRVAINRKIDIGELDDLPPPTAPAMDGDGRIEPHRFDPGVPDLYERAVRKGRSGNATATVWDYSEQMRILGHYLKATEGSALSDTFLGDVESTFRP